jgi:hypothetical protein
MADQTNKPQAVLACGDRVQLCDNTLQAFYGRYGTVLHVRHCPRSGQITRIAVQMDDVPASEGYAIFTPANLATISIQPSIADWSAGSA